VVKDGVVYESKQGSDYWGRCDSPLAVQSTTEALSSDIVSSYNCLNDGVILPIPFTSIQ